MNPRHGGEPERELKFALDGLESLRERLIDLEAERRSPPALEENWVLDRKDELQAEGCLLRLRKDGQGAVITFKGPARFEGGTKIRVENETRIDDLDAARALFENLGFRVIRRYQKVREQWLLGGVTIALDHTPIGDFAEFEGSGAETVAKRCGFLPAKAERRTYLGIYDDLIRAQPELPEDMIFK